MTVREISVPLRSVESFSRLLEAERMEQVRRGMARMRQLGNGRVVWNVNSTSIGGGVAEMLASVLAYARGAGVDMRWLVIQGTPEFFLLTKRLHNALHGAGGPTAFDAADRALYEQTLRENAAEIAALVRPGDIVFLHDPQTAGLIRSMARLGALVVWRCHIGADTPNAASEAAWDFLAEDLDAAAAYVFSRAVYVPPSLHGRKVFIIPPSLDPFSPKNQSMAEETVKAILVHAGIVEGPGPGGECCVFERADGAPGRVDRSADVLRLGRAPLWETPLVTQVSRWDRLKDPVGVLRGFAELIEGGRARDAELVLAGPNVRAVADDPEGVGVYEEVAASWRALPHHQRRRVHLVCLPTADVGENAAIVNALQRHAAIVVQKSLREGFGLTVTEGMWKARPVIASRVGGIQEQIEDGVSGLLLADPRRADHLCAALDRVLGDEALAASLGRNAHEVVREKYLVVHALLRYTALVDEVEGEGLRGRHLA